MKVIFTDQSLESLEDSVQFLLKEQTLPIEQVSKIIAQILENTNRLAITPLIGQREEYLDHLELDHRRIVVGHFKIIYRVESGIVYITDFFDTRQDPAKMKG